jgi:hypothetical protein
MRTYENTTPLGLKFHLCYTQGVCYIMVYDMYDMSLEMKYFTNVNNALRWINSM